jgi:hypothetical protein
MKPDSSHVKTEILTSEAIEILRRACKNSKTRTAVVRDPSAFLARQGIDLADDVELRVYQRKAKKSGKGAAEPMLTKELIDFTKGLAVATGIDERWRATHDGCPFPTIPYTTRKKVTVCDLWALAASGREWVQDVPGTAFGHWVLTGIHSYCLLSHDEWLEVTECLPPWTVTSS